VAHLVLRRFVEETFCIFHRDLTILRVMTISAILTKKLAKSEMIICGVIRISGLVL
jgi:hypothetical protein